MRTLTLLISFLMVSPAAAKTCYVGDPYCGVPAGPAWETVKLVKCPQIHAAFALAPSHDARAFVLSHGQRAGTACIATSITTPRAS